MRKSELRQIIREEISSLMGEPNHSDNTLRNIIRNEIREMNVNEYYDDLDDVDYLDDIDVNVRSKNRIKTIDGDELDYTSKSYRRAAGPERAGRRKAAKRKMNKRNRRQAKHALRGF